MTLVMPQASRVSSHMTSVDSLVACLVAAGMNGAIESGNCDKGIAATIIRHNFLLHSIWMEFLKHLFYCNLNRRTGRCQPTGSSLGLLRLPFLWGAMAMGCFAAGP